MKFIKKIFLSLAFLFIGLNPNLYSMEEIGSNVSASAESTGSWFGWMPEMPELPSMPEMPTFSFRDTLNNAGSGLSSFFGYSGPFKFAHSGAERLALLNDQKSSILNIGQELLKNAQTLESVGLEADVASILQAKECLNPFVENLKKQRQYIFQNAQTTLEESPKDQSWLAWLFGSNNDLPQLKTTYPLHDAIQTDGIQTDAARRYAVGLLESEQNGVSELEQCLGSVENQKLITPLKEQVLQGQDEINAQARRLRFESLRYNFTEFVKQAWEIPAVKVALGLAGATAAPIILYKLYRGAIWVNRLRKGERHSALVKKETELLEEIKRLSLIPVEEDDETKTTREQNLTEKGIELSVNTNLKRSYEQHSYSTLAVRPYIWSVQQLGSLGYNCVAKPCNGTKWVFSKIFKRAPQAPDEDDDNALL